jgi:hypothetical protein
MYVCMLSPTEWPEVISLGVKLSLDLFPQRRLVLLLLPHHMSQSPPCHVMLCYVMLCHVKLCHVIGCCEININKHIKMNVIICVQNMSKEICIVSNHFQSSKLVVLYTHNKCCSCCYFTSPLPHYRRLHLFDLSSPLCPRPRHSLAVCQDQPAPAHITSHPIPSH